MRYNRAKCLSERTIEEYEQIFNRFCKCYEENNLCCTLKIDHIYSFIEYLKDINPQIRATTINSNIRNLRAFFYYLMKNGLTPQFHIALCKADKRIIEIYTDFELKVLTAKPNLKTCTFCDFRDWAIINFELATGARSSTLLNIKLEDVCFNEQVIIFRKTKSRKQQIIPLSPELEKILKFYLKYRKGSPNEFLFCSDSNQQLSVLRLAYINQKI